MSEVMTRPQQTSSATVPSAQTGPASMLQVIAGAAANPDCDVQKMQALLAMQDKLIEREARKEFSAAMAAACGEIPQVEKNGTVSLGGKGGYKFSKWEDMDRVIRPVLAAHSLRLSFNTRSAESGNNKVIVGTISHANGQSQSAEIELPIDAGQGRNPLQGFGSTISYGKRYCAEMLLNIVRTEEDNDGRFRQRQDEPRISAEQKEEIVQLLQASAKDPTKFLAWVGAVTVDEMTPAQFQRGRNALMKAVNEASK